jgi:xylitol oxidase
VDKRQFLKTSGSLLTGTLLSRYLSAEQQPATPRTNWSGNLTFHTDHLYQPKTTEEVQQIVKSSPRLRALGRGHSFNTIADSNAAQISLKQLDQISLDPHTRTVTVGAGVTYGQLAPYIDSRGYAVHNLASLPHISVVGACATATHGSGSHNGNLSTAVSAMEIVTADGQIHTLSRAIDGDPFLGAVVSLGGLGIITRITLNVEPTFQVAQAVYEDLSMSHLEKQSRPEAEPKRTHLR